MKKSVAEAIDALIQAAHAESPPRLGHIPGRSLLALIGSLAIATRRKRWKRKAARASARLARRK